MEKAQCVTVVALNDCHFFVSQNEKEEDSQDTSIETKKKEIEEKFDKFFRLYVKCVCDISQTVVLFSDEYHREHMQV
jgi:hypothetical protein